ncbi:hypothetical protein FVQ98_00185 [Ottowia sp. GY511]|uniref:Integral membrane protein n=1 Tax=Ottowia flava TaxID=2675430 RepID=A0ABW4KXL7_9BURK|nr:hypothetical protein [Ottowia sp. GY511]TXK33341.1 hypothetical protein FVQ98_00185 [Ottowia sp. GY511]
MKHTHPTSFLRQVLLADGAMGLAVAAVHLLAGALLASWLALPSALLLGTGVFLLGWGVGLIWLGRADGLGAGAVWAVIGGNALWALAAITLLLGDVGAQANGWGRAYLVLHALIVVVFAELQWWGLRRSRAALALRPAGA